VRYAFGELRLNRLSGTTSYRARGTTCRGRLTLRAKERGGFVFRDRSTTGRSCTTGDSVFVRPTSADRISVRVRERSGRVTRFALRRV